MRKLLSGLLILLMVTPIVGASPLTGSAAFLISVSKTDEVQKLSLILMALSYASNPLGGSVDDEINSLALKLAKNQNPDGGWGYHLGQASDVPSTAYAVTALIMAKPHLEAENFTIVRDALERGVSYLLSAEGDEGWGYVPHTAPAFYPTALALWALGEYGYSYAYPFIKRAALFLNHTKPDVPENEALALRVIAYSAVGYPVPNSTVERIVGLLSKDNLKTKERAMLTYALELVRPIDFTTARLVAKLRNIGRVGANYTYWFTKPEFYLSSSQTVETTAYALMAVAAFTRTGPIAPPTTPSRPLCKVLLSLQNPDGGWPVREGEPSQEIATYYALRVIDICHHPGDIVERAINWTEIAYKRDMNGTFTVRYFYALETLLRFNLLNDTMKEEAINYIFNSTVDNYDYLWGNSLGPQPYETALAIRALLDLGVSPDDERIRKGIAWILSVGGRRGWGTIVTTWYRSYSLVPSVGITIEILDALDGAVPRKMLMPYANWLASQRVDGGWAEFKAYFNPFLGRWIYGKPRVFLTVRATDVLSRFGYNFTNETLNFVLNAKNSGEINEWTLDTAMAIDYLSRFKFVPPVTLYDVESTLWRGEENFTVIAIGLNATKIALALQNAFGGRFNATNETEIGPNYYVVVAPYGTYDVSRYNPHLEFSVLNGTVRVGKYTASASDSIAILPGATARGMVLFVFYGKNSSRMAEELFTTGFIKYLRGNAMLIVNENGRVVQYVVG